MPIQCAHIVHAAYMPNPTNCGNGATKHCMNCGLILCWQHYKKRCPKGGRTNYGFKQHMTREQDTSLRKAPATRLSEIRVQRDAAPNRPIYLVTIERTYETNFDRDSITLYPGALEIEAVTRLLKPDRELSSWLSRTTGEAWLDAHPEYKDGWTSPERCRDSLREAIRNRTARQRT